MPGPVTNTTTPQAPPISQFPPSNPVPHGIASQPSTITTEPPKNPLETVKEFAGTICEFIRNIVVAVLEGIRSGLGVVAGWFGGSQASPQVETPNNWQVPVDTRPIPTTIAQDPFHALVINDTDRQKIYKLINTMGGSPLTLLLNQGEMLRIGDEIQNVHPLKFLEYVFKHPTLPKDMETISSRDLTWTPFMNGTSGKIGLSEKLRRDAAALPSYKTGFARSLNVALNDINPYFTSGNWPGMVKFLIEVKTGKKTSVWVEPTPTVNTTTVNTPTVTSTTVNPPTSNTTPVPPVETSTTLSTPQTPPPLTPTQTQRIADLPFEPGDGDILSTLIQTYAQSTRVWLGWNRNSFNLQWNHLGERHPLRVLSYLYSKPVLMNQLLILSQYSGTKFLFIQALTAQLSKKPFTEIRPYIEDFTAVCHLDPTTTLTRVQNGNWNQLIEDLIQSYNTPR